MDPERVCVLVVDDQPIVIEALRRTLAVEAGFELHACLDASTALEAARAQRPSVILQDLVMPDVDGFAMLRAYQEDPGLAEIPIVVLSSREDPRDKSRAFALGASDYLVKIPDPIELVARVRAHSRSFEARRERDAAYRELGQVKAQLELKNAELESLAVTDGLTGLANRRHLDQTLDVELRRAHRDGIELSLILADVDHFKRYNDRYGHVAGDECLRQVAGQLRGSVRRVTDLVARYGGEEFAVVLPSTPHSGACEVAEAIRAQVAELGLPHEASDVAPHVTLSLGVASVPSGVESSAGELIARADRGLYLAKRGGRNRHATSPDA